MLAASIAGLGQQRPKPAPVKCTVPIGESPQLRSFRLGQRANEIDLDGFSEAYIDERKNPITDSEKLGLTMVQSYRIWHDEPPKEFEGTQFMLHFLDDKLTYIEMDYTEYEVKRVSEFIAAAAPKLGLPTIGWKYTGIYRAELICDGFAVWLWTGRDESRPEYLGYPNIAVFDRLADAELDRRLAAQKAAERKAAAEAKALEREKQRQAAAQRKIFKP